MNKNLKKILIKTKKQVFTEISGNNSSSLKGEGYDFLELREYEFGEDIKNIDWTISAKMNTPYVKVFHAQKELNINILPILNGSMIFGTKKIKQDLVTEVCSLLAFSSIKQGDPFSSFIVNEKFQNITKRSKKLASVASMSEQIFNYNPIGKEIDYKLLCNESFKLIKMKSILFLIGDFIGIEGFDLKLLSQKHEIFVIIIRDIFEENPQELGNISLVDTNNGLKFEGIIDKYSIKDYKAYIKKNDHDLFYHLQKCNVRFTKICTHEEAASKIITLVSK
ncbi:DUF58 domain-containing protein [Arcobacter sp. F2176]|uniref:DUF58 domain-containing protein n=1 Tax=Arcobacter sp. F2176 TaxID=2044511 RepID=UPI00100A545A|nr:DUF58 domain-containing protein [Arcobacter sp. F2176]RXJ81747.1 DUF58 domain-containing protein [Arcobacter sp. F2176]